MTWCSCVWTTWRPTLPLQVLASVFLLSFFFPSSYYSGKERNQSQRRVRRRKRRSRERRKKARRKLEIICFSFAVSAPVIPTEWDCYHVHFKAVKIHSEMQSYYTVDLVISFVFAISPIRRFILREEIFANQYWLSENFNFQCNFHIFTVLQLQSLSRWIINEWLWIFLETTNKNVQI